MVVLWIKIAKVLTPARVGEKMKDKQLWFDKYIVPRNFEYRTLSRE